MDQMIAVEMCEVLNPMMALNKLTVYSNPRHGITHAVTDNVIAADTTKYRNPLDKLLPEHDKLTPQPKLDKAEKSEKIDGEKETEEKISAPNESHRLLRHRKEQTNVLRNTDSNHSPNEQIKTDLVEIFNCVAKKPAAQNPAKNCLGNTDSVNKPLEEAANTVVASTTPAEITCPKTANILPAVTADPPPPPVDTGRYSRGVKQTTKESSARTARLFVPLVKETSTFSGALCCGKDLKTIPVSQCVSPFSPPVDRQAKLNRRRRHNQQSELQPSGNHFIEVPEINADLTSSTSFATNSSEANASSVELLPVLPPILRRNLSSPCDSLQSPPLQRHRSSRSPSGLHSPTLTSTQTIQIAARSALCTISSSSSSPSFDEDSIISIRQGSAKIPQLEKTENFTETTESKGALSTLRGNLRRVKANVAAPTSNSSKATASLLRKVYQSGGKRALSPTKSPKEIKRTPAVSSLNLGSESALGKKANLSRHNASCNEVSEERSCKRGTHLK
ncbi:hypothetical protein PoB_007074900 [Plakobranchus ocellatus]|uniref:Uncharacterized protein n=1 Tax=Plakobranchus ocellatus TaxID=259542 RepID=A0AAV4DJ82_9GAST|nr:hypothetical protein PoB_007074900 [Plakobranchus ocellatus]